MPQKQYRPQYAHLKNKWTEKKAKRQQTLWEKHRDALEWVSGKAKHAALGGMAGLLVMTQPSISQPTSSFIADAASFAKDIDKSAFLVADLQHVIPDEVRALTPDEEANIARILSRDFHIHVAAELEGKRLNRSYGYIGAEQHLARYPGDTIGTHFDTEEEARQYTSSGMAPGLGAYGYFAPSKSAMTQKQNEREKYYIAVQTFLAPGFSSNVSEYYYFFKHRKMLIVNPQNGKAMVVVIGDAGPAEWTGKHLGGSPEVMRYLERVDGKQKGPVLYYFIDDPKDTVPLGPITLQ